MRALKEVFSTFTTPDGFRGDWYGYVTNQVSHWALGSLAALAICSGWYGLSGELPYRWQIAVIVAVIYVGKELLLDGWQGLDTVEDFVFTVVYGSGGAAMVFYEVDGLPAGEVAFSIALAAPLSAAPLAHLALGCFARLRRSLSRGGGR